MSLRSKTELQMQEELKRKIATIKIYANKVKELEDKIIELTKKNNDSGNIPPVAAVAIVVPSVPKVLHTKVTNVPNLEIGTQIPFGFL